MLVEIPGIGKKIILKAMANNTKLDLINVKLPSGETVLGNKWTIDGNNKNIIIFEGMKEHVSRYDNFARFLNSNGYDVYALDHFGQGLNVAKDMSNLCSWPKDGFKKMAEANNILITELSKNKACYIFSHSMGSYLAQLFMELYPLSTNKVVLCGAGSKDPALGIGYTLAKITTPRKSREKKSILLDKMMFSSFNKKIKNPETPCDWLSYNKENVSKYVADPLCGYDSKKGFLLEFLKGLKLLYKKSSLNKINKDVDVLIIAGEEDPVGKYAKAPSLITKMLNKYGVNSVKSIVYPHTRHEILNEDIRETVYKDVLNFFNK